MFKIRIWLRHSSNYWPTARSTNLLLNWAHRWKKPLKTKNKGGLDLIRRWEPSMKNGFRPRMDFWGRTATRWHYSSLRGTKQSVLGDCFVPRNDAPKKSLPETHVINTFSSWIPRIPTRNDAVVLISFSLSDLATGTSLSLKPHESPVEKLTPK